MPRSKRVQVLMEPAEFARLEHLAAQQGLAVAALIRQAVNERFFGADNEKKDAAARLNSFGLGGMPPGTEALASRLTLGRTEGLR